MITATFRVDEEGHIFSYEVAGHSGYAEEGEDIICAAVSVLAIETVNSIDRLAFHQMTVKEADEEGGYLYAEVQKDLSEEQRFITEILLKHLYYSLEDVAETYPDYVKIERNKK